MSPNLYATAFGLAGLAGAWRLANQFYGTPGWIEDALYLVATAIYPLLVATFAAKLIDQPKAGAMFLGFVMLVMITVLIGGIALWSLVALRQGVPALAQRGGLPQVIHCMRWPCSATRCVHCGRALLIVRTRHGQFRLEGTALKGCVRPKLVPLDVASPERKTA